MTAKILITGGAGFVGAALARLFRQADPQATVVAFDNLHRRGAELNLPVFKREGIGFVHGDIRVPADFEALEGSFDVCIEASAEPSVLAGSDGNPHYLLQTNLAGTINCLEYCRRKVGGMVFLSTSRVYGIPALRGLPLREGKTRLELDTQAPPQPGLSAAGIQEGFSTDGPRSLYGASKLCSEVLVEEYMATYGLRAVINRCGVICGPGQFGKVDQGVFTLWVVNHALGRPLTYTGFGGNGKQVRDLLHPRDLFDLIVRQVAALRPGAPHRFTVGGGVHSASLLEMTALCQAATGRQVEIGHNPATHPNDVPFYVTDHSLATATYGWRPQVSAAHIVNEIAAWLTREKDTLAAVFG